MANSRHLAGHKKICGHRIRVACGIQAAVALGADFDDGVAPQLLGPDQLSAKRCERANVLGAFAMAAFTTDSPLIARAQRAGLAVTG